jgi:hypothetical protein
MHFDHHKNKILTLSGLRMMQKFKNIWTGLGIPNCRWV